MVVWAGVAEGMERSRWPTGGQEVQSTNLDTMLPYHVLVRRLEHPDGGLP